MAISLSKIILTQSQRWDICTFPTAPLWGFCDPAASQWGIYDVTVARWTRESLLPAGPGNQSCPLTHRISAATNCLKVAGFALDCLGFRSSGLCVSDSLILFNITVALGAVKQARVPILLIEERERWLKLFVSNIVLSACKKNPRCISVAIGQDVTADR